MVRMSPHFQPAAVALAASEPARVGLRPSRNASGPWLEFFCPTLEKSSPLLARPPLGASCPWAKRKLPAEATRRSKRFALLRGGAPSRAQGSLERIPVEVAPAQLSVPSGCAFDFRWCPHLVLRKDEEHTAQVGTRPRSSASAGLGLAGSPRGGFRRSRKTPLDVGSA
jgi:hypothetical protein